MESVTKADAEVVEAAQKSVTCCIVRIYQTHYVDHGTPIHGEVQRNAEFPFETDLATDIKTERHIGSVIVAIIHIAIKNRTFSAIMAITGTVAKTNTSGRTYKPVPDAFDIECPIQSDIGIQRSKLSPHIADTCRHIQIHSIIQRMLVREFLIIPTQTATDGTGLRKCDTCYGKHNNHCCNNLFHIFGF